MFSGRRRGSVYHLKRNNISLQCTSVCWVVLKNGKYRNARMQIYKTSVTVALTEWPKFLTTLAVKGRDKLDSTSTNVVSKWKWKLNPDHKIQQAAAHSYVKNCWHFVFLWAVPKQAVTSHMVIKRLYVLEWLLERKIAKDANHSFFLCASKFMGVIHVLIKS